MVEMERKYPWVVFHSTYKNINYHVELFWNLFWKSINTFKFSFGAIFELLFGIVSPAF